MKSIVVWILSLALVLPALAQPAETPGPAAQADTTPAAGTAEAGTESSPEEAKPTVVSPMNAKARVISGIKGDVVGGGWVAATLLNGTANTIVRSMRGEKPDKAAVHALKDLTKTEFLVGSLLGGSLGAAIGSALPVPILRGAPLFVRTAGAAAAPLAFGAVAGTLATNAILLHKRGKLTAENLMKSVDWASLAAQTVGSLVGMSLGATLVAAGLAPAFALGSVAMVPLIGGIAGAVLGSQILSWIRTRRVKADEAAASSTGTGTTGPETPNGAPKHNAGAIDAPGGSGVIDGVAGGTIPDVTPIDAFGDLPLTEAPRVR